MRISHANVFGYRLPLKAPLSLGDAEVHERSGFLLRLEDSEGNEAWGDVAPLPGFSPESLPDAKRAICAACADLSDRSLPDGAVDHMFWSALPPSVRFGIEQAVLSLAARRAGVALPALLADAPHATVFVNDLLRASDDAEAFLRRAQQTDYRAVKLKVGRRSVEADARLVERAREALPPAVQLRLDANRTWSFEDARDFAERIVECDVAYVEEPLRDPALLLKFADLGLLPVALDESVVGMTPDELDAHGYANAIVLKPTLLGLRYALRMGRRAEALGMRPVVSGAYESGVGGAALVALAAAFRTNAPAGLTTYRRLRTDLLAPPLDLGNSSIDVNAFFSATHRIKRQSLNLIFES